VVQLVAIVLILLAPYIVLSLPGISQAAARIVFVSVFLLGVPAAIVWLGLKSQIIRPGAKLYQPRFDSIRPKVERNLRILAFAFALFFFLFFTLPFATDLLRFAAGRKPLRIVGEVSHEQSGSKAPVVTLNLSHDPRSYYLFYRIKPLLVGRTYEFDVLPQSGLILDYRPD
jgi:hypothetical protein